MSKISPSTFNIQSQHISTTFIKFQSNVFLFFFLNFLMNQNLNWQKSSTVYENTKTIEISAQAIFHKYCLYFCVYVLTIIWFDWNRELGTILKCDILSSFNYVLKNFLRIFSNTYKIILSDNTNYSSSRISMNVYVVIESNILILIKWFINND